MKHKIQKLLSILLSAMMLVGLMPTNVFAETTNEEVTNITTFINAPKLGQTPDYDPTYVSSPSDSVTLLSVRWFKIAVEDYTGTDEDEWLEMEENEEFTTGYYYALDMDFESKDGFEISESITGTINGMPHNDTFGSIFFSSTDAYLSIEFQPLKKVEYVLELPVNVAVKLNSDEKPKTETFKLEIFDCGVEDAKFEILNDTLTAEDLEFVDGAAYFDGVLKIKVDSMDELLNLTEGFKVRMVKGSAKNWTYASEVWHVNPIVEVGPGIVDINYEVREIVDDEISDLPANGMLFTVSYGVKNENQVPGDNENHTPNTGDTNNLFMWLSLLFVSCIAGVTLYSKRKETE